MFFRFLPVLGHKILFDAGLEMHRGEMIFHFDELAKSSGVSVCLTRYMYIFSNKVWDVQKCQAAKVSVVKQNIAYI